MPAAERQTALEYGFSVLNATLRGSRGKNIPPEDLADLIQAGCEHLLTNKTYRARAVEELHDETGRIASKTARNALRSYWRARRRPRDLGSGPDAAAERRPTPAQARAIDIVKRIQHAVARLAGKGLLPQDWQLERAVTLLGDRGLSLSETARRLGVSRRTLSRRLCELGERLLATGLDQEDLTG